MVRVLNVYNLITDTWKRLEGQNNYYCVTASFIMQTVLDYPSNYCIAGNFRKVKTLWFSERSLQMYWGKNIRRFNFRMVGSVRIKLFTAFPQIVATE